MTDKMLAEQEHVSATCGNPKHPDGAWHTATPIPFSWDWRERMRQRRRRKRYGCPCISAIEDVTRKARAAKGKPPLQDAGTEASSPVAGGFS